MVKFAQHGTEGFLVGLGLSHENLRLVCEQLMPIVFPASDVALGEGKFCIGTPGMAAALRAQLGSSFRSCIELSQQLVDQLLRGEMVTINLGTLGYAKPGVVAIFAGPTEQGIVDSLRGAGLLTESSAVIGTTAQQVTTNAPGSPWVLMACGALLTALGGIAFANGKSLAVLVLGGGIAVMGWALSMLKK